MSFQNAKSTDKLKPAYKISLAEKDMEKLKLETGSMAGNARLAVFKTFERRLKDLQTIPKDELSEEDKQKIARLYTEFSNDKETILAKIEEEKNNAASESNVRRKDEQQQQQQALTEEDLLREQLEFMHNQTQDITHQMKEINKIQNQLYDKVKEDSGLIVKVDENIEEAKDDMITGNVDLNAAEKHLKKTCNVQ